MLIVFVTISLKNFSTNMHLWITNLRWFGKWDHIHRTLWSIWYWILLQAKETWRNNLMKYWVWWSIYIYAMSKMMIPSTLKDTPLFELVNKRWINKFYLCWEKIGLQRWNLNNVDWWISRDFKYYFLFCNILGKRKSIWFPCWFSGLHAFIFTIIHSLYN